MKLWLGVVVLALTGCGGAVARSPESPLPGGVPVESHQAELDRAEAELDDALRSPAVPRFATPPPPSAQASPAAPTPAEALPKLSREEDERRPSLAPSPAAESNASSDRAAAAGMRSGATSGAAAPDRCALACRALASMARAAESLCELQGDDDGRCRDARARVEGASARVQRACPSCS